MVPDIADTVLDRFDLEMGGVADASKVHLRVPTNRRSVSGEKRVGDVDDVAAVEMVGRAVAVAFF